jgi:type IV pilus assembly protein PilB
LLIPSLVNFVPGNSLVIINLITNDTEIFDGHELQSSTEREFKVIFGRKKPAGNGGGRDDDDEEELDLIKFTGAINGASVDWKENAKLAQVGLERAKIMLSDGMRTRAQVIRLEHKGEKAAVYLIVDGIPAPGPRVSRAEAVAITQVIKLLAGLDIKDKVNPQSGGINGVLDERKYTLIVETTPLGAGLERLVIKVMDNAIKYETPEQLGFSDVIKAKIREFTGRKSGITLATGASGSGVTSLAFGIVKGIDLYLYSVHLLGEVGQRDTTNLSPFKSIEGDTLEQTIQRIIRVESDIVYLPAITTPEIAQTAVKMREKIGLISEIKAPDAATGILKFVELAGNPQDAVDTINAIFSQKLIRVLCPECRKAFRPNPKILAKTGLPPETRVLYKQPKGTEEEPLDPCEKCGDTGYFGRTSMIEMIEMTDEIKQVVLSGGSASQIRAEAKKADMPSFKSDGLRLVALGKTSLEELQRVFAPPS